MWKNAMEALSVNGISVYRIQKQGHSLRYLIHYYVTTLHNVTTQKYDFGHGQKISVWLHSRTTPTEILASKFEQKEL